MSPLGTVSGMYTPTIIIRQPKTTVLRTFDRDTFSGVTDIVDIATPTANAVRYWWHTPTVDAKRRLTLTQPAKSFRWNTGDILELAWLSFDAFTLTRVAEPGPGGVLVEHLTIDACKRVRLPASAITNLGLSGGDRPFLGVPKHGTGTVLVVGPAAFESVMFATGEQS